MALVLLVMTSSFAAHPASEGKVELKVIKYQELSSTVRRLVGKVVVVDFWADF